jgi:hypothetical protein
MPHKFKAFVAGYGCLRESSLVITEQGPIPIADIDGSKLLLSWSEKNNQLELAPSTASYPKGKENLYRVITTQGEFVASGAHRVYNAQNGYQSVESLVAGEGLCSFSENPFLTTPELAPRLFSLDEQHYLQKLVNYLCDCVVRTRQCGQRLQTFLDSAQDGFPSLAGAQGLIHPSWQFDDLLGREQEHNRRHQFGGHIYRRDSSLHAQHPFSNEVDYTFSSNLGHNQQYNHFQLSVQSQLISVFRHIVSRFHLGSIGADLLRPFSASGNSYSSTKTILALERLKNKEYYWDLSVLNNNCYLTTDGSLHHNSGKTWVGCSDLAKHFWEHPGVNAGYFAPTYPQIRDIFYPTIEEALEPWGLSVKIRESNKEVDVYRKRAYRGTVMCRSMDRPESIIGFKIGHALVDEIDVMNVPKATTSWRKIIARLRHVEEDWDESLGIDQLQNGINVTTTPEGFKFVYNQFKKQVQTKPELGLTYGLVQASTYDNEANLPDDYIPSLLESYPLQLIEAYINGQFVNLKTGSIYSAYDRVKNRTDEVIREADKTLYVGMDFNVGSMAAVVHVLRSTHPHAVDEISKGYDTPDMIRQLKERYWKYDDKQGRYVATRQIIVYPDSSGDSRKSVNASETDIALIKAAGFRVRAPNTNPPVKNRINSMNAMFCNAAGERRYYVNPEKCPTYAESLEQQAWLENGEPDKTTGFDHHNDAGGYYIWQDFPIRRRMTANTEVEL